MKQHVDHDAVFVFHFRFNGNAASYRSCRPFSGNKLKTAIVVNRDDLQTANLFYQIAPTRKGRTK